MKKMMTGILTSIAAMCIGMASIPAVAQGIGFTDSDGNGVCDNRATRVSGQAAVAQGTGFTDSDSDGVCDNRAARIAGQATAGQGAGFTDNDGDGVCDNRTTGRGKRNARRCMRGGKELCTVTVN